MGKSDIEYDLAKNLISLSKRLNEESKKKDKVKKMLREAEDKPEKKEEAIPITNDARFGDNVLKNQIENFKKTVNGGAKFASENQDDPESNPLIYYPETGNLVFSGSIPSLSGMKFQFSLNDVTNAPYIFVDGLALTEEVVNVINKMRGYFLNWKDSWNSSTDLLEKLKKKED
jgi:hypothetical protein